jgi:hypothetical protein
MQDREAQLHQQLPLALSECGIIIFGTNKVCYTQPPNSVSSAPHSSTQYYVKFSPSYVTTKLTVYTHILT